MRNISILAWDDTGGVSKIHKTITTYTSSKWVTEYMNTKSILIAGFKIFRLLNHRKVARVLVGNGREALIVWIFIFLSRRKINVYYVQHTPLDHTPRYFRQFFSLLCRDFTVITISHELRRKLIKFLPKETQKNIKVIYNPVLQEKFKRLKIRKLEGPINFIAIGRLTYQKNYEFMIGLIKYLNLNGVEASLKILGEGEDFDVLSTRIAELELDGKVELLGYCNDVNAYLSNIDFFIMTSLWEGLPTSLIEALNSSARIVAYKCPTGVEEILSAQFATRTVDDLDYEAFYQMIRELILLEGEGVRDMRHFNRDENIARYEELFDV